MLALTLPDASANIMAWQPGIVQAPPMSSDLTDPRTVSNTGPAGAAPTLSEVAKRAGVSSITVSRVVRMPDLVAPETRARVEQAMRDLGYIPNLVAGALA